MGSVKKIRSKGMKNSNTKAHYLTDGKWHQLERHCWFFRTIAVLNTAPGSNINIKEIIGNYECSSLARRLFDASSLPNHGGDRKSDLVHAIRNSIDGAWIDPRRYKLDVKVIDAMSAILITCLNQLRLKAFKCSLRLL